MKNKKKRFATCYKDAAGEVIVVRVFDSYNELMNWKYDGANAETYGSWKDSYFVETIDAEPSTSREH